MNRTLITKRRFKTFVIVVLIILGTCLIPAVCVLAQTASGLSLKLYSDPEHPTNEYTLSEDDAPEYAIKLIMVLKNISGQRINTERGFSQVELHRALIVKDPCGNILELPPEAETFALDAPPPRFIAGRPLVPAETLKTDFAKSLIIDDLRKWLSVMKVLPGKYIVSAQLKGARFIITEYDEERGLQGVGNHPSNWFGIIHATTNAEEKPSYTILILPVSGGRLKVKLEEADEQSPKPLFNVPVKAFRGTIADPPEQAWEEIEPVLTGTTSAKGEVAWKCDKCLPKGSYTIIAKYQDDFQVSQVEDSDSSWDTKCSGVIEQTLAFGEEPQPSIPGDLDGDGDVDMDDIKIILAARNTPASGPDDPRDLDGDGMITGLDARKLVLLCTRPGCATE